MRKPLSIAAVMASLVLAAARPAAGAGAPALPEVRAIEIEAGVLEFAPTRADLAVSIAQLTLRGARKFQVNGEETENPWKYIDLREVGKNRFELPALEIEFSEEEGGFLCMSVKVWFDKLANEFDSMFYENLDDRYALVSYCTRADVDANNRFRQNRVATLEEFKETLAKPFAIKLNRRRVPSPGIAIDERGTVFAFIFLPEIPLGDRNQLWKLDPDGMAKRVPLAGPRAAPWRITPHRPSLGRGGALYLSGLWEVSPDGAVAGEPHASGGLQPSYETPVAADGMGNIYFVAEAPPREGASRRVQLARMDPEGKVHAVAGSAEGFSDGALESARFADITAIAAGRSGDLYVADGRVGESSRIRRVDREGKVTTIAGSGEVGFADGEGGAARFRIVSGLSVDRDGSVYVADRFNTAIRKVALDGVVATIAGGPTPAGSQGPARDAPFADPADVAVAPNGDLFVLDCGRKEARILRISPDGKIATVAALR